MKRKFKLPLGVLFVLLIAFLVWFYFSPSSKFLSDEQILSQINDVLPSAKASVIQESIAIDDRHMLVPFISIDDTYGLSYWKWEKRKWNVEDVDINGGPIIWMIDSNNPSTYHFVWNIHPEAKASSIHFYLDRKRDFLVSGNVHSYFPQIKLEENFSFEEKTYGYSRIPAEWSSVMDSFKDLRTFNLGSIFPVYSPMLDFSIGWNAYDENNNEVFSTHLMNGNGGYSNGKIKKLMLFQQFEEPDESQ